MNQDLSVRLSNHCNVDKVRLIELCLQVNPQTQTQLDSCYVSTANKREVFTSKTQRRFARIKIEARSSNFSVANPSEVLWSYETTF